jgi:hypothetical protein
MRRDALRMKRGTAAGSPGAPSGAPGAHEEQQVRVDGSGATVPPDAAGITGETAASAGTPGGSQQQGS